MDGKIMENSKHRDRDQLSLVSKMVEMRSL